MKRIGIIGAGFSGTMTAVHLLQNASEPIELFIINQKESFIRGIAYNPYSQKHLLNVPTAKMGAFADKPGHFLDWVMQQKNYSDKEKEIVGNSFLPRFLYGDYLENVWKETVNFPKAKRSTVKIIESIVSDAALENNACILSLDNGEKITVDYCVLASGNHLPGNPKIKNTAFYQSKNYFRNPWDKKAVSNLGSDKPVLIIGNGLTMVDTVLGLLEQGFTNSIYSISPNGFNILPHRHIGLKYTKMADELSHTHTLRDIVRLFNKHIKLIRDFGLSAEPLIDSLRPHTQEIWLRLTQDEKRLFMGRLRHLWGVARHRIPLHIHDKLQQLRIDKKLFIRSGKLNDIIERDGNIEVSFFDKKEKHEEKIFVSRVINCTGPETDLIKLENSYLKNLLERGVIFQDELKLGINADVKTFNAADKNGNSHKNIFVIGSNLKGMLWESTAVNELREQAERIAKNILQSTKTEKFVAA